MTGWNEPGSGSVVSPARWISYQSMTGWVLSEPEFPPILSASTDPSSNRIGRADKEIELPVIVSAARTPEMVTAVPATEEIELPVIVVAALAFCTYTAMPEIDVTELFVSDSAADCTDNAPI